ncbi:subtilisin like protease [Trichoderma cornu-damae]|uniref:Subtilisin like protease n=1 Tax=Trichoderma cornu-damae TaxID=654480 RepID=A0A9P8QUF1_9HYPO|nr:subtilisin like protease [Trichoderma cornu-damae]
MKVASVLGLAGLVALSQAARVARDYDKNDYYVLHLDRSVRPSDIAIRLGLTHEGQLGELTDHHVFRAEKHERDIVKDEVRERKRRKRDVGGYDILDGVLLTTKQKARSRLQKRVVPPRPPAHLLPRLSQKPDDSAVLAQTSVMRDLGIADPTFKEQWHLLNTVQVGHDVNVTGLWLEGITGKNATVAMVDDGLDMFSRDLKDNYFAEGSWDFNDNDPEPKPVLPEDKHGTRCAGEISAVRNDVCGVGVAYDSKIAGIRILSSPISDADEAEAMIHKYQDNQIYSCSWGPPDDGRSMEAPDVLIRRAMLQGVQEGRGGLGSIYVFASGNGALSGDNCNFDGYTNSIYSITVGAVDRAGLHPYYSEHCSALLVVTYSSGSGDGIHTTDVGENACYSAHGGTSAAAPLAAGIFALVMQVRPDLTWRDLQYLAMDTAVQLTDQTDAEWQTTSIGRQFSHTFGYGKIDSYALVEKAKTWNKVKPQSWLFTPWLHVKKDIPEGNDGLVVSFDVTPEMLKEANVARLEHVTVTMNVEHTRRGDLSVDLVSPDHIVSHISVARKQDSFKGGYDDWTFMSVAHWGESGVGRWTLIVRDTEVNNEKGKFIDWHLKLWGESIDASKAKPLPMPSEDDDDDHDLIQSTVSGVASTESIAAPSSTKTSPATTNPTDHPVRPTKPGAKPTESAKPQETPAEEAPSDTEHEAASGTQTAQASSTTSASSSWVSWLPTFGTKAKIWIYGAIGLIAAFCCGLGIYLWIARRRRLRNNPRNDYEFELLDEEETEGLNSAEKGPNAGKKTRRTRGGELYDAFAGGSDDDDEFDEYRDRSAERLAGHNPDEPEHYAVGEESDDDDVEKQRLRH